MTRRASSSIPPVANEPVWQSSGEADATAIVSALRAAGIPATLRRIGDVQRASGGSYFTATVYAPARQAVEARRILRERGEARNIVDMDAFRGYGRGSRANLKIVLGVVVVVAAVLGALVATGQFG